MANFNSLRSCGSTLTTSENSRGHAEMTGCGCGCGRNTDCGCAAAASVHTLEDTTTDACTCCKASMRDALKLLCCNAISDLVDFESFAFISDINYVGTTPAAIVAGTSDNLGGFEGTFRRFSPCNCDLLDIAGTVFSPSGLTVAVTQANLCTLSTIAFELLPAPIPVPDESLDTDTNRFRRVRELLQRELQCTSQTCGECAAHCDCTDDCCCTASIVSALSTATLNNRATLSAGLLSLQEVSVLGTIGSVLVLANETQGRFYFVCANKVDFLV